MLRSRPRQTTRRSGEEAFPPEVADLLARANADAVAQLDALAQGEERAVAKAARRALYKLKLAGIEPPAVERAPVAFGPPQERGLVSRAMLSNAGGTGARMVLFVREDPYGGSPMLVSILVSDTLGIADLAGRKLSRRELAERLQEFLGKPHHVIADVPVDYARWVLKESAEANANARNPLPEGYTRLAELIGPPSGEYHTSPVYERLDSDDVRTDLTISHSAEKLLKEDPLQGWMLDVDEIRPWMKRVEESQQSRLALDPSQLRARAERVLDDATDALLGGDAISRYRRRLEDTAYVLDLGGQRERAREALYQALSLKDEQPPHTQPFLRALVTKSVAVATALEKGEEDDEDEEPGLIERIDTLFPRR